MKSAPTAIAVVLGFGIASINVNGLSQEHFMSRSIGVGEGTWDAAASWASSIENFGVTGVKHLRSSWGLMWDEHTADALAREALEESGHEKPTTHHQQQATQTPATQTQQQANPQMHQQANQTQNAKPKAKGGIADAAAAAAANEKAVPSGRKGMYFRPVSVTLQCVMLLTITALMVYTILSISRNSDELSATFVPSTLTQTLTIGSRVAAFAPMMCMLFVGCRMYVLATTEGLGEPPAWVKSCMKTACAGMGLQLLVVMLLPAFTKKQAVEEASYDMTEGHAKEIEEKKAAAAERKAKESAAEKKNRELEAAQAEFAQEGTDAIVEAPAPVELTEATGDQNDVHPAIGNVDTGGMKAVFWLLQIASMLCLYGGLTGVIVGIATFPVGTTQVSTAVKCTILLSALYFMVCFLLWMGRAIGHQGLTHAALAMSSVVRKAPMFSVLFLASRMRALQLDPPHGMPPFWMQCCFLGITGAIYVETFFGAIVGATGELKKGYYGVYLFKTSSKTLQMVQHTCAIATYCLLFPIIHGVYAMKFADGSESPLSTTLRCVVTFETVYFTVMFGQSLTLFAEEVKGSELPMLRDSFVSAGISLGLAPLLCILFVATRMRALQITQQEGDPPGWAQDCMLIAVFATCVQALCCLVMPIFIGKACEVDDDGNPDYDLQPMVGAYAVAVVKYVALIALHGAVIMVCLSVYAMTPETAHSGNRFIQSRKDLLKGVAVTLGVFFVALLFSSAKVIGMGIKMAIEACDETLLGVTITVKKVALNLFKGYVHVSQLRVHNPDFVKVYKKDEKTGKVTFEQVQIKDENKGSETFGQMVPQPCEWKEDYIAKMHLLLLKVNVARIITTLGKEFELQNLSVQGIKVNVEKPNTDIKDKNSNIEYIMNHLDALGLIPPDEDPKDAQSPKSPKKEPPKKEEPKKEEPKKEEAKKAPPPDIPKIILHKIVLGDIGAGVTVRGVKFLGQISFHVGIGTIEFDDIQRDIFGGREDLTPGQSVACIIKAIAKKIFKTVVQEIPREVAKAGGAATKAAAAGLKSQVTQKIGGVARGVGNVIGGITRKFSSGSIDQEG